MSVAYARGDNVLHRNAGSDVVVLLPGDGDVHLLSGPAAVMWDLLAEARLLDDLIQEMAGLYGRPVDEIAPSVRGCLDDLATRRLVEHRGV